MLTESLRHVFPAHVRQAGDKYFREGRAHLLEGDDEIMDVRVRGTRDYSVVLRATEDGVEGRCDCPAFRDVGPCKHVWAALMLADVTGCLGAMTDDDSALDEFTESDLEDEDDDDARDDSPGPQLRPPGVLGRPTARSPVSAKPPQPTWRHAISQLSHALREPDAGAPRQRLVGRRLLCALDVEEAQDDGRALLRLFTKGTLRDGRPSALADLRLRRSEIEALEDPVDREMLAMLAGGEPDHGYFSYYDASMLTCTVQLSPTLQAIVLPLAARTDRLFLWEDHGLGRAIAWDDAAPWTPRLHVEGRGPSMFLRPALHRDGERRDITKDVVTLDGGFVLVGSKLARLTDPRAHAWLDAVRRPVAIPEAQARACVAELLERVPGLPLELPQDLAPSEVRVPPLPRVQVRGVPGRKPLEATLAFDYADTSVTPANPRAAIYDAAAHRLVHRDPAAEAAALATMAEAGFRRAARGSTDAWTCAPTKLSAAVRRCLAAGWHVEAEGQIYRRLSSWRMSVTSGVDWFDLEGAVEYEGGGIALPALLRALARGEGMVRLSDGSFGMLPEDWLARFGRLAALGAPHGERIRFARSQAMLLDALLASRPEAACDATFDRVRQELRSFEGIVPAPQPAGFRGTLRDYQREGLGWFAFLRRFGFGGCLADDMGVGKTAQVLALLEERRQQRAAGGHGAPTRPSLVVVPRSLVFNWLDEAARFTPRLRVLDATGQDRDPARHADHDVVLVTYGTLRRDAPRLAEESFDYVVLDEAQAIKNASSATAKAARLLKASHRLAVTGTPVENHLGELWSLFEFLNPGMLGSASVFQSATGAGSEDPEARALLARALRPFILRRTKEQVARELPARTEQVIHCSMDRAQRELYDELRTHYRASLLGRVDEQGMGRSKMHVLEALLRLRQAACHPGLIDPARADEPSAKLDTLMARLEETCEEGHRALVFSQFTSFLAIVRRRLEAMGVAHEYLDGQTRDRQARVEGFQSDASRRVFLISLKAGGLGLNLTGADYVFLLDPWWNPAVEAQAIDRTHRIGQTRPVFAYRLVASDTIEEKVLALQASKRDLAAAVIGEDNSVLRGMKREDLELLLS